MKEVIVVVFLSAQREDNGISKQQRGLIYKFTINAGNTVAAVWELKVHVYDLSSGQNLITYT